jgi:hypothetical protein
LGVSGMRRRRRAASRVRCGFGAPHRRCAVHDASLGIGLRSACGRRRVLRGRAVH